MHQFFYLHFFIFEFVIIFCYMSFWLCCSHAILCCCIYRCKTLVQFSVKVPSVASLLIWMCLILQLQYWISSQSKTILTFYQSVSNISVVSVLITLNYKSIKNNLDLFSKCLKLLSGFSFYLVNATYFNYFAHLKFSPVIEHVNYWLQLKLLFRLSINWDS